jgi:Hint module
VESGRTKFISEVSVGERVLSANTAGEQFFSDVVFVPHKSNKERAMFVHITTSEGRDVKMTQSHILPAGACGKSSPLPLEYAFRGEFVHRMMDDDC